MRSSDLLARIGGVLMAVAAFWNVMAAIGWVLALWWLVVGLFWLVPLALAVVELGFAATVLLFGYGRLGWVGPLIGLFVSLCNLNFLAMMLELVNLVLMCAASVARTAEA